MGINKFEAGMAGVLIVEALAGATPAAAQKQGYNRAENEQYGGANRITLPETQVKPQGAHIEVRDGKTYLVVPTPTPEKPQTNPHNFPQPEVPADGGPRLKEDVGGKKETLQQQEQLKGEATIGLTADQAKAFQECKPESLLGKNWYDLGFHVRLDEQGNILTDIPTVLTDPDTELGAFLLKVVLPDAVKVLKADNNTSRDISDGNDTVYVVFTADDANPNSIFVSPTIEDLKNITVDGVSLPAKSRFGYTEDGGRMLGIVTGDGQKVGVVKMNDGLWDYLKKEGTFDPENLPPMGDRLFLKTVATQGVEVPMTLYTPGNEYNIPSGAGIPPTELPKYYAKFGEKAPAGASLNVEHVANDKIPTEVLKKLGPWTVRVGDTGWIVDYSKSKLFQMEAHKQTKAAGNELNGYVYMPESTPIVTRLAADIKTQLQSPEYQTAHIFAIDPITGKTVEMPKFDPNNLPVVVVENHDPSDYGAAGNPKGEPDKTRWEQPFDSAIFVRYWDAKNNTIIVKRYFKKGTSMDTASIKNVGIWGSDSIISAEAIYWGYVGTQNISRFSDANWNTQMFALIDKKANVMFQWVVPDTTAQIIRQKVAAAQGN